MDYVDTYLSETLETVKSIDKKDIRRVLDILFEAWQNRKHVFTLGNGGSASTASHLASDLCKYTIVPGKKRFRAMALTDNVPLMSAWTNDNGFEHLFSEQLTNWIQKDDVVFAISVHGGSGAAAAGPWSQNLLRAVDLAKQNSAKVVGLVGFDGGIFRKMADASILVPIASTPQVEGLHVVLCHLIVSDLRQRIGEA